MKGLSTELDVKSHIFIMLICNHRRCPLGLMLAGNSRIGLQLDFNNNEIRTFQFSHP